LTSPVRHDAFPFDGECRPAFQRRLQRVIGLLGNLSKDILPGKPPHAGGGPYHGGRALQRLRVPARIVARCAIEDRDALLPPLVRLGTPVRYVPGTSTATFGFTYDGDRRTMWIDAIGDTWLPGDVPELRSRWIHIAPLSRAEWPTATVKSLARRHRVSFDGQGLVRAPHTGALELNDDFDRELLRYIWVLKLADEEAEVIGDVRALSVREVVVTHGSRGSTVYCGGVAEDVKAHPLDQDPTGAGDAFATSYIVGRNAGFGPVGAARRATAVVASLMGR
jgi:sugar/nucleoside kinase (ribokinase family)